MRKRERSRPMRVSAAMAAAALLLSGVFGGEARAEAPRAAQASHWSFVAPERPDPPAVHNEAWVRNPIDNFILSRLEAEGLEPSPEADRYTLIRRLSLDLTGLPPTPEQVERFIRDTRPDAYERLADRLLESPAYGERWAQVWLDLARYADTNGYEKDERRTIWRYRDWVIDALNDDMPFDRFTIEQIAGDLLPTPTMEQRLATAFHRNTMTNTEGGTDNEEFRVAAVVDRVNTTGLVWMGLAMSCAQCHDHKYDPVTQREYFELFAFFNQTADNDEPGNPPTMPTPTADQREEIDSLEAQIAGLRERLAAPVPQTPAEVRTVLAIAPEQRNEEQRDAAAAYYREHVDPELRGVAEQIGELEGRIARVEVPATPIMQELPADERRTTYVHTRGNFRDPGEQVSEAVPAAFHPMPEGAPMNRLGVAKWLVDEANPLTARVQANRFWSRLFGTGIVDTEEDFGSQGNPPSHPELLDWLAVEFMDNGWSKKRLLRTIVTSAAYRQSSAVSRELLGIDPDNRLLARGPRFRLEAEMVRDQALAASGLLSDKMHGPSVMPPQPEGVWQVVYSSDRWETSEGDDRYRRGVYTFLRRTSPYPSMTAFDATSREVCAVRRVRTNTPLQSLVTMNDPAYVEAAQALARRMVSEGGETAEQRAAHGFRLALVRPPSEAEADRLVALYRSELAHYRAHPSVAEAMATDPLGPLPEGMAAEELAAWTVVANVLLNLDEALTKG